MVGTLIETKGFMFYDVNVPSVRVVVEPKDMITHKIEYYLTIDEAESFVSELIIALETMKSGKVTWK